MMLVQVIKLSQLAYCNCIYVGLLLNLFMAVTSSLKWTKLHSSHLFLNLRIPYLGKLCWEKVMKFWKSLETFPRWNFQKSEIYKY